MRLGALELVEALREAPPDRAPDLIVATSLVSAADLRACLPPPYRGIPLVVYMHENQAAYPTDPARGDDEVQTQRDHHFAMTNLASVLAADCVVWNSDWNRRSFLDAMTALLRRAPDAKLARWRERVEDRSIVIWPPVEPPAVRCAADRPTGRPVRVVWPHRWEHDKGPDELLELARRWTHRLDLRWVILGQRFPAVPDAIERFAVEFADRIDHFGFETSRDRYLKRLLDADWVLSTARHEFFGIAVVEAMLCGCLPWLPPRLSYPELLPREARALSPERPPTEPASVRAAVWRRLRAAEAPEAVARLDECLARTARQIDGPR